MVFILITLKAYCLFKKLIKLNSFVIFEEFVVTQSLSRDANSIAVYFFRYFCLSLFGSLQLKTIDWVYLFFTVMKAGNYQIKVPKDSVSGDTSFLVHRWLSSFHAVSWHKR